jgi:hypothetical protein
MSDELLLSVVGAVIAVAIVVRIAGWMEQTADLRLSLFRPYRGETWPQGVQEEDGVRWRWTRTDAPADQTPPPQHDDGPVLVEGGRTTADRVAGIHIGRADGRRSDD